MARSHASSNEIHLPVTDKFPLTSLEDFLNEMDELSDKRKREFRGLSFDTLMNQSVDELSSEMPNLVDDPHLLFLKGLDYYHGHGEKADPYKAFCFLYAAAEYKHPEAQAVVGYCYHVGRGVKKNAAQTLKYYRLAAQQGVYEALLIYERIVLALENKLNVKQSGKNNKVAQPIAPEDITTEKNPDTPRSQPPDGDKNSLDNQDNITIRFNTSVEPIGHSLKAARIKVGKTQKEVADAMGITDSTVRTIESGKSSPSIDTVERYASALGLKLESALVAEPK